MPPKIESFGILSFFLIGGYLLLFKAQPAPYAFLILCIGSALLISILLSGKVGTVIPLLFKFLKLDPAVASGPLITTVNDLVAVVSLYAFARFLLISVLHFA